MELLSVPTDAELAVSAMQVAADVQQHRLMLVTAESCTGGWIAKTLTDIPGSSAWFDAGVVTYSYDAKASLLGVNRTTLERYGAVSEETALEMVSGALDRFSAGVAVAVTGIAGPTGGTPDKPVGTVWISWQRRGGTARAKHFHFTGDREAVRRQTVAAALVGLRETLAD
jgi:nicotinamide-nucleotide amidase